MTKHYFRDILEHDMDMLFLEEFCCDKSFGDIFLSKVGITDWTLLETWQSKTDVVFGESDMTVIVQVGDEKVGILIEDKIDAIAMPEQPQRYNSRGQKGIEDGLYDKFFVFIVAPKRYLETNDKAREYPNQVSYEEIREYFIGQGTTRSRFKISEIEFAINKQHSRIVSADEAATDFWKKYIIYTRAKHPDLQLRAYADVKATNGCWARFHTCIRKAPIIHKTNKGFADLTFFKLGSLTDSIRAFLTSRVNDYREQGFVIEKKKKSCVVSLTVPVLDFSRGFEQQVDAVEQSLKAVEKLVNLTKVLDCSEFLNLLNEHS